MTLEKLIESFHFTNNTVEFDKIIPIAMDALSENMLLKAKFYEGDLLMTVLSVNKEFWKENNIHFEKLLNILNTQSDKIKEAQVSFEMKGDWYEKIENFKRMK